MRHETALIGLSLLAVLALGCTGGRYPAGGRVRQLAPQLRVTRVTLYQNGVAYFEREGKVKGDVLTLHCRPSQINDLLKSLTVIDRGSGRAVSVSLPLDRNSARVLSELPRQVRNASGLLDVLRVFRGARVRIEGRRGKATGRVVGVEQGLLGTSKKRAVTGWRVTLKTAGGALRVYPVADVKRLVMLDRALEVGLDKSLDVSLEEGTWKPITLSVRLTGKHTHDLLVSYIVEMPNWKPAYRLVVPEGRKPLLQGWAVVDNVSGESWRAARLSLVAGTPMSFIYNLHAPRFSKRMDLTPRGHSVALAPPSGDSAGSVSTEESRGSKDRLQRRYARRRSARGPWASSPAPVARPRSESAPLADASRMNILLEKQVRRRVQGKKVGGLFRYDLQDPVTVPDNSSTAVNIINARVSGAQVVLFRPELMSNYAASHPYRAVRFANDSGFALEKGPVTIYAKGTFVGEGFLERMEKGQTIFLTYAIDRNVSLTREQAFAREPLRLLKISGGRIVTEVLNIYRGKYKLQNRHEKAITAYIKTQRRAGYKLRNAPQQTVYTSAAAYVPVTIEGNKSAELKIEWVSPVRRYLAVDSSLATNVLKLYIGRGQVPAHVKPTLDKILAAKARIDEVGVELHRLARLRRELRSEQARVRQNLDLLRKVKGNAKLRATVTRNLGKLEDQLSKLTARYVKLDEERSSLRRQIHGWIGTITLDNTKKT